MSSHMPGEPRLAGGVWLTLLYPENPLIPTGALQVSRVWHPGADCGGWLSLPPPWSRKGPVSPHTTPGIATVGQGVISHGPSSELMQSATHPPVGRLPCLPSVPCHPRNVPCCCPAGRLLRGWQCDTWSPCCVATVPACAVMPREAWVGYQELR